MKAVEVEPTDTESFAVLAQFLIVADRAQEGLDWIQKAIRRDPGHPKRWIHVLGNAYREVGQYTKAAEQFDELFARPGSIAIHYYVDAAAAYQLAGRIDDAREAVNKLLEGDSVDVVVRQRTRNKNPEVTARLLAALRQAGLPEELTGAARAANDNNETLRPAAGDN